jgi:hypothetical protein
MTIWLLPLLAACLLSTALLVAPLADARVTEEALSSGPSSVELEEASAEASEAAQEQMEMATAQAEDAALPRASRFSTKAAQEYPSLWARIVHIKATIERLQAEKRKLRELPQHSKRRKVFLPKKHMRIMEERQRSKAVHQRIRAKKEAARA